MKTISIIGAGIIGCALAKELSTPNTDVHILEKNESFGEETSSRNSGVIHSGLYYPPHSLKSQLCLEGFPLLYDWCKRKSVPHRKTGKLILAKAPQNEAALGELYQNALRCGVNSQSLRMLSSEEIRKISPHIKGSSALHSLNSGIVDVYFLCKSYCVEAIQKGAQFHYRCEVKSISTHNGTYALYTSRGEIQSDIIINSAGLYADEIASFAGMNHYKIFPWRGDYFKINLPYKLNILLYPAIPLHSKGLGVHFTFDMHSNFFLGPDAEPSQTKNDYTPRLSKKKLFYNAACRLLTQLSPKMLSYETCGIRPKLRSFDSIKEEDFVISEDMPGFFNLVGIESPGVTASLAIANFIKKKIFK